MILGNDVSSFQGNINFTEYAKNANFVIIKASEGTTFTDPQFYANQKGFRDVGLPLGYYHFARPDLGNDPAHEADWFLKVIGTPNEGELLCLDYEVTYADPVGWCKLFLDRVKFMTQGTAPLIYLNQSLATSYDWSPVVNANYGLWIAYYSHDPNVTNAQTGKWAFAAMQQWTDNQSVPGIYGFIDGDVFFGDVAAFKKYGYHAPVVAPVPPPQPPPEPPPSTPTTTVPPDTNGGSTLPPLPNSCAEYKNALAQIDTIVNKSSWWTYLSGRNRMRTILKTVVL